MEAAVQPNLRDLVEKLEAARAAAEDYTAIYAQRHAEFCAGGDVLISHKEAACVLVKELEADIRALAVEQYRAGDPANKQPAPGVGIRVGEKVSYLYGFDEADAYTKEHDICREMNVKAFEEVCGTAAKPGFVGVTRKEIITATIAKDLAKALGSEE